MTMRIEPPREALRRRLSKTRRGAPSTAAPDLFVRETFILPREAARSKAREWFESFPKAAYWTSIESWRELPENRIEFTMRRLPTAD